MAKPIPGFTSPQIFFLNEGLADPSKAKGALQDLADGIALKGNEDRHKKRFDDAIEKLTRSIALNSSAFAFARRGDCFFQQGKFDEAIADLTRARELKYKPIFVLARRGDCYRRKGMVHEAIADLNIVLMRKPRHVFALASRGDCFRKIGVLSNAIADLTLAIEIMPDNAFALTRRGDCHLRKGDTAQAMLDLKKAEQLNPNGLLMLQEMAFCLAQLEHFDQSINYANRALEIMRRLTPDDKLGIGRVVYCRGECHKETNDLDKAIQDFSEVIDLIPGFQPYRLRALCYEQKCSYNKDMELLSKAIEDLVVALEHNPEPDSAVLIFSQMGNVFSSMGVWVQAINSYTHAILLKSDADYYVLRAIAYKETGDLSAARKDVECALALDPNHPTASAVKKTIEKPH